METKELVIKTLKESGKPMKSAEIAEKARLGKAEVDKILKTLKKEEKITSPKACYYSLK
ncbi:MAG: transcriptional regulator [Bacteroidales bacterium]